MPGLFATCRAERFLRAFARMIWVGTSGFRYPHWRGAFYPRGLPQRQELAFATHRLASIEINGSFYSLQRPSFYVQWREQAPTRYRFAVKGGRFITHMKKLHDVRTALANFFASGVLLLGDTLGPVLWQFPENMPCDLDRFNQFFELLPRTAAMAADFAAEHADRFQNSGLPSIRSARPIRYAIEIRNPACVEPAFMRQLAHAQVAWVIADTAGRFPYLEQITTDFIYIRLHGDTQLYASGYSTRAITRWAQRIATWSAGAEPTDAVHLYPTAPGAARDVYVYFDNDGHAHAPRDALALQAALAQHGCEVAGATAAPSA